MLTSTEREVLLALARASIAATVTRREPPTSTGSPTLPDASGVFVTIKRAGTLRGCLGTLRNERGLAAEVSRCASEAASADPRFPPVEREDLPGLRVEVSVLGPLEPIDPSPEAFTIGVHGLVVDDGSHRGLLLPQVAVEWGWSAEEFLSHTALKAGLPPDAWRRPCTRVYRFAAEVFGD